MTNPPQAGGRRAERSGPSGILARLAPDRGIECGPGWYPLLKSLDGQLWEVDHHYRGLEVKQNMAQLVFRWELSGPLDAAAQAGADRVIRQAEARSRVVCELCGNPGTFSHRDGKSFQVLCRACRTQHGHTVGLRPITAAFAAIRPVVDPGIFNVWTGGKFGKFAVTADCLLSCWTVDAANQPTHAQMAEARGYHSVMNGRINPDGVCEITWAAPKLDSSRWFHAARMPGTRLKCVPPS